ncbi:MAG TPA: choice-of-anchor Q domain-containing protein, partial [Ktedonobacteraceae bacterium]
YFATSAYVANTIVRNNILDGFHPSGQDYGYISGGKPVEKTNLVTTLSDNGSGTNPKYANPSGGDYSLQTGSPAINAGTVIPGITDGYVGSAPDIGAYESGATRWLSGCLFTGCGRA